MNVVKCFVIGMLLCMNGASGHPGDHHGSTAEVNHHLLTDMGIRLSDKVAVKLVVPYPEIIRGEFKKIYVGVKNSGNDPVVFNGMSAFPEYTHFAIEVSDDARKHNMFSPPNGLPRWEKIAGLMQADAGGDYHTISPGGYQVYESFNTPPYIFDVGSDFMKPGMTSLRVGLMTGSDEWAVSDWESVDYNTSVSVTSEPVIQEVELTGLTSLPLRKINIGGKSYIFLSGHRICILPDGVTPRFEVMGQGLDMTFAVHFEGADFESVLTKISNGETLSGPRELVPHLYIMNGLEKVLSENTLMKGSESLGMYAQRNAETAEMDSAESRSHDAGGFFARYKLVLFVFGVILLIVITFIVKKLMLQSE